MRVQLGTVSEVSPAVGRRCLFAMGFAYISTDGRWLYVIVKEIFAGFAICFHRGTQL